MRGRLRRQGRRGGAPAPRSAGGGAGAAAPGGGHTGAAAGVVGLGGNTAEHDTWVWINTY